LSSSGKVISKLLALALLLLYGSVLALVFSPRVNEEYRAYYIDRSTDEWRPVRYSSTPEEGIDFSRNGLPSFVRGLSGVSHHESWGRWTDATRRRFARIDLAEPLTGDVCVSVKMFPAKAQFGKKAHIRIGGISKSVVTANSDPAWYSLDFRLSAPSTILEIEPESPAVGRLPGTWDPKNPDSRRMGLGLQRISIAEGNCAGKRFESSGGEPC